MAANEYYPNIDSALNDYARDRHMTLDQVASRLGICRTTFYYKLTGRTAWKIPELCDIARLTRVSYEELLADPRSIWC